MAGEQQNPDQVQYLFSDFNTRLRELDERNRTLRERVLLLGNNLISTREDLERELKILKKENLELKSILREIKRTSENLIIQSERFIKKEETAPIQRMLKDFKPLEFMRKKDVEELIEEKIKQIKPRNK